MLINIHVTIVCVCCNGNLQNSCKLLMQLNSLQVEDKLPQAGFELWPISSGPLDSVKLHVGSPLSFWAMLLYHSSTQPTAVRCCALNKCTGLPSLKQMQLPSYVGRCSHPEVDSYSHPTTPMHHCPAGQSDACF